GFLDVAVAEVIGVFLQGIERIIGEEVDGFAAVERGVDAANGRLPEIQRVLSAAIVGVGDDVARIVGAGGFRAVDAGGFGFKLFLLGEGFQAIGKGIDIEAVGGG